MIKTDWEIRRDIVAIGKRVYARGLVVATDGNISVRMMSDRVMITPSGSCFESLNVDQFVYMDLTGQVLGPGANPSSEWPMHLEIYRKRPDINAIIHAHPPIATAFSVAGSSLSEPVLPESVVTFGSIPTAPYATPATRESADAIRELIETHDVIILDHHGAVAAGKDLDDAFQKMERLEHVASTLLAARQAGGIIPLTTDALKKLEAMRESYRS